ncbi:hypothetical protein C8F01DRAFT_1019366 [Mycena amicta]|nr:hypothetical protein C8F01DRAFT_1019366 [Mycena amicta]
MLYPPYQNCPDPRCASARLTHPVKAFCRLYTLRRGVLPAYQVSLYCRLCSTRYYYAYSVSNASDASAERLYHKDTPTYIQAQDTSFLEDCLCEYFELQICLSHTSTTNLARLYNSNLGQTNVMSSNSALLTEILPSAILDGFFMHALFRRCRRYNHALVLPHNGLQEHRFDTALDLYNTLMAGNGQPQYMHACHDCLKFSYSMDGELTFIRAGTTDGVTLGHPCCAEANCQVRLRSMKDHYCFEHRKNALQCHMVDCSALADPEFITCAIPAHREEELQLRNSADAAFQDLSRRLESSEQTRKPKLRVSRRWTHNEQLFVMCCGIITARATFFSAEGPASVKEFLKRVFHRPWLLPTHIFFDKACQVLKHLHAQGDTYFKDVRLVVDVFHANKNHDEVFCNTHNIPSLFPELRTIRDGKTAWTFNSSVAEQANVWFGAFQAMSREMSVPRYNFFLDEMVLLRNEWLVADQQKKNKQPFLQSEESLMKQWQASQ